MRYYYKNKDNTGFLNLKSPLINDERYVQITEEEFNELAKPKIPELTAEQKAKMEKARKIAELKKKLSDTDYIVLKIAEAQADGEAETVAALKTTYATELANRKTWREQINAIEAEE